MPPACAPVALRTPTSLAGVLAAPLVGWADGAAAWQTSSFCSHAADSFQWLAFRPNVSRHFAPGPHGSVRVLADGYIRGSATVVASSATAAHNKYVIVGSSELSPGVLPFQHAGCRTAQSACGACLDGFAFADCQCDAGTTEATFTQSVRAGQLVQVAAIPAQFEGTKLQGALHLTFLPGLGKCAYQSGGVRGPRCDGIWDGVALGGSGCGVALIEQDAGDVSAPVTFMTQRCALGAYADAAPHLYRVVGSHGGDGEMTASVRVLESSNVAWSGGGLLLTAADGSTDDWVALRVVQATDLVLESSAADGSGLRELGRLALPSRGREERPWLQLSRLYGIDGGRLHARWRLSASEAWREMPGSPLQHRLSGEAQLRVGLTHQTDSENLGKMRFGGFALAAAASAASPHAASEPKLMLGAAWRDEACVGTALALDEHDDHVALPPASLCALGSSSSASTGFSLRIWFRTSGLEGQWYSPGQYANFEEWLFAAGGAAGASGSLNVYLVEGSGELRTQICPMDDGGGAACLGDALTAWPKSTLLGSFADDAWHMYVLTLACEADNSGKDELEGLQDEVASSCEARVYIDGLLASSASPIAAPLTSAALLNGGGVLGGSLDLDPRRFYGGLLARFSLAASPVPSAADVRAEYDRTASIGCGQWYGLPSPPPPQSPPPLPRTPPPPHAPPPPPSLPPKPPPPAPPPWSPGERPLLCLAFFCPTRVEQLGVVAAAVVVVLALCVFRAIWLLGGRSRRKRGAVGSGAEDEPMLRRTGGRSDDPQPPGIGKFPTPPRHLPGERGKGFAASGAATAVGGGGSGRGKAVKELHMACSSGIASVGRPQAPTKEFITFTPPRNLVAAGSLGNLEGAAARRLRACELHDGAADTSEMGESLYLDDSLFGSESDFGADTSTDGGGGIGGAGASNGQPGARPTPQQQADAAARRGAHGRRGPKADHASVLAAVEASLEQQVALMKQLTDLEFDAGLVGLMRRRVKALEHELHFTRQMRGTDAIAPAAATAAAAAAADAGSPSCGAISDAAAMTAAALDAEGITTIDDGGDVPQSHARDRHKANLLFVAQRQLEIRGRELSMLAQAEPHANLGDELQAQLARRRDSVIAESKHLARLLAHLAQRMQQDFNAFRAQQLWVMHTEAAHGPVSPPQTWGEHVAAMQSAMQAFGQAEPPQPLPQPPTRFFKRRNSAPATPSRRRHRDFDYDDGVGSSGGSGAKLSARKLSWRRSFGRTLSFALRRAARSKDGVGLQTPTASACADGESAVASSSGGSFGKRSASPGRRSGSPRNRRAPTPPPRSRSAAKEARSQQRAVETRSNAVFPEAAAAAATTTPGPRLVSDGYRVLRPGQRPPSDKLATALTGAPPPIGTPRVPALPTVGNTANQSGTSSGPPSPTLMT